MAWGGVLSGFLYIGATLTLLVAVDKNSISVLQGIVQAVSHMAGQVGSGVDCCAVRVSAERVDCGNWFGVAGRLGADSVRGGAGFVPARVAWEDSPEIRDAVRGVDRARERFVDSGDCQFCGDGAECRNRFSRLLSLAVVLQLIPFLYVFGALLKIAFDRRISSAGTTVKGTLIFAGVSGLVTTVLGIALAFFPAQQIKSLVAYEIWMVGGTLLFIGLAAFFFYIYGSRKAARKLAEESAR